MSIKIEEAQLIQLIRKGIGEMASDIKVLEQNY